MDRLKPLVGLDELERVDGLEIPAFVHRDHRWTLCLIRWAQEKNLLPTPCKLITFDFHQDSLPPIKREELEKLKPYASLTIPSLINACKTILSGGDDDWITAGMELGILSDAVVFGVDGRDDLEDYEKFQDSEGVDHRIYFPPSLPGCGLGHQGWLNDDAREWKFKEMWEAVDWENAGREGMRFREPREKFALDFDLDCFTVSWREYNFPWPDEVWKAEFRDQSEGHYAHGMTGTDWVDQLRGSAGLVTFATEPECCNGLEKVRVIWESINAHLFGGRLTRNPL